jgi:NDP-sugar pyrophosphorylase family protein
MVNGDTLTDLDLQALADAHHRHDALVTMAVTPNPDPRHYGGLRLADDGTVLGVVPRGSGPSTHFIGVQVVHRDAFADLPPARFANSVGDVYDRLIARRSGSVRAHMCEARFWDIGTVKDYWITSHEFMRTSADLRRPGAQIHETARVDDCIAWDDVHVGERCVLSRCIITDGVAIAADTRFQDAILLRGRDGRTVSRPFEAERHD